MIICILTIGRADGRIYDQVVIQTGVQLGRYLNTSKDGEQLIVRFVEKVAENFLVTVIT